MCEKTTKAVKKNTANKYTWVLTLYDLKSTKSQLHKCKKTPDGPLTSVLMCVSEVILRIAPGERSDMLA